MSDLENAIKKAEEIHDLYYNIIFGDANDFFTYDNKTVFSLKRMMRDAINNAILSGDIEIPEGKIITDIYVNANGELIIDTKDL